MVEGRLVTMIGIIVQVGTALDAEAQAVIPAQGLEWQIENHLVTEQWLEVDEIALKSACQVIVLFDARVDVKLLDVDLKLIRDLSQAPYALSADLNRGGAADEHSLDHRFEPQIQLDRRTRWYPDHGDSEVRRSFDSCSNELHRARATAQFMSVEDQS